MTSGMMERSQVVANIYQKGYQDGKPDIVAEADSRYQQNLSAWQLFFYEQLIDRKVYLGDQRYLNLYSGLSYEHQKYVFNVAMPVLNMVVGRQRQHRKATRMVPVHGSSSQTASQATKALQSDYYFDDTYNTISNCFKESSITGLALMHSWIDYRRDPICGDLKTECFSADMVMMDAFWREMDLSDCQFIRTRKYLHKSQVKELLPGRENDIDLLNDQAYFDTKFTFMPQQYNIRRKGYLAYDEYWYQTERMATFMVDPETYESTEVDFTPEEMDRLKHQFPHIVIVKEKVPTVHLAIIVNNTCFYDGPNPLSVDFYPFTPFTAYHDLANNNYAFRYQGIIRNIRDPQYLYNYRKQLEMDLLAAQFSGVDVEEDALVDDQDAFKVGPGKVRFFKKNRMQQGIRDVPGANINPANFQVTEQLKQDIQSQAGVTPELLGQAEDSDVGITEQLRQGAALTTLQELFDNLNLSQRNAGRLHWALIQKNYTLGKIRKMIEEEPTNEFRDKSFQKYDAVVTQAPLTDTTKQLAYLQKYSLWKDGLPIPVDMLLADLEIQDKDKMIEAIQKKQEQEAQMQQQQSQLMMQNQQVVNESLQSKAESDRSLAQERMAKGRLEQFQIMTAMNKSEHEKTSAVLNTVKAAKEVESMGIDDFVKVFSLIENMKSNEDKKVIQQGEKANVS
jgi:hypothetical protein